MASAVTGVGAVSHDAILHGLAGRRLFLTGHTGFKGSWLTALATALGAEVHGFGLSPNAAQQPLFDGVSDRLASDVRGDVRDANALASALAGARPDIVIHLAGQSLVHEGFRDPTATIATNVMGTVHLVDAARRAGVGAVVVATSDKCYADKQQAGPFVEVDRIGGDDPYSASKAAAELAATAFRGLPWANWKGQVVGVAPLATARAGNVIGGGDFAPGRIVPDFVRALASGETLTLRRPAATRPWQHVLEPVSGYLAIACQLLVAPESAASAFNIGPDLADTVSVANLLQRLEAGFGKAPETTVSDAARDCAVDRLALDNRHIAGRIGWRPRVGLERATRWTADWYMAFASGAAPAAAIIDRQTAEWRALV